MEEHEFANTSDLLLKVKDILRRLNQPSGSPSQIPKLSIRQEIMKRRLKIVIRTLLEKFYQPEYELIRKSPVFPRFVQMIKKADYLDQTIDICVACVLPCCLDEFPGDSWTAYVLF